MINPADPTWPLSAGATQHLRHLLRGAYTKDADALLASLDVPNLGGAWAAFRAVRDAGGSWSAGMAAASQQLQVIGAQSPEFVVAWNRQLALENGIKNYFTAPPPYGIELTYPQLSDNAPKLRQFGFLPGTIAASLNYDFGVSKADAEAAAALAAAQTPPPFPVRPSAPSASALFPSIQRPIAGPAWQHPASAAASFANALEQMAAALPALLPFGWYGLPPPPLGTWFLQAANVVTGADYSPRCYAPPSTYYRR